MCLAHLTIDCGAPANIHVGEGIHLAVAYNFRVEHVRVQRCRGFAGIFANPTHVPQRLRGPSFIVDSIVLAQHDATDRDAPYGKGIYISATDCDFVTIARNTVDLTPPAAWDCGSTRRFGSRAVTLRSIRRKPKAYVCKCSVGAKQVFCWWGHVVCTSF